MLAAAEALRPYRGGPRDEPAQSVLSRMGAEVARQVRAQDIDDLEDPDDQPWEPDARVLEQLLMAGIALIRAPAATAKWAALAEVLREAPHEKIVLFAQPIETVTALVEFLDRTTGLRPAVIVGGQDDSTREAEISRFRDPNGPRLLVSSRAGGEGINLQVARRLVHLDVPWNPMEMEQRVGRVHRFGSLQTIIVHTLVVQGTREVDAYRVAREKLRVAFADLARDPDRFEALFSRVMSLIPPQQLEDLLGRAPPGPFGPPMEQALGELVEQGLRSWREFHAEFAAQKGAIAGLNPGEATWDDLTAFLETDSGAERVEGFRLPTFREVGDEVVSVLTDVPALKLNGRVFACADTEGIGARNGAGEIADQLGLNLPAVVERLREAGFPAGVTGAAWLRPREGTVADFEAGLPDAAKRPFAALVFLRQTIRFENGTANERALELRSFVVTPDGAAVELPSADRSRLIRSLLGAARIANPSAESPWPALLAKMEEELFQQLGRPSPDQFREGLRYAVWPVAACVVA